ncbi:acyltransferase family protein [Chelatococcus reniformis]|nr:acyltransferase [Chelatococcus reniformis]
MAYLFVPDMLVGRAAEFVQLANARLASLISAPEVKDSDRVFAFPLIDVLRAFAAISVVVYHVIEFFEWKSYPVTGFLLWFRIGWMGVDLFFVISGFVIGLSAFRRLDRRGPRQARAEFVRHRLARIVPLHYLTCLFFVAFITPAIMFSNGFWAQIVSHALFVHNLIPEHHRAINNVNWTLGVEMQFYLLIFIGVVWLRRAKPWLILALGLSITWIWRSVAFAHIPANDPVGVDALFMAVTQLPGMLDEFTFGLLLARIVVAPRGQRLLAAIAPYAWIVVAMAGLVVWAILTVFWMAPAYWTSWKMVVLFRTLIGVGAAACVLATITIRSRILLLLTAPVRYLGTISYGIYLWHLLVILSLHRVPGMTPQLALPVVLAMTFVLAAVSWHYFERPILRRYAHAVPK